jgi:hypothetical protein
MRFRFCARSSPFGAVSNGSATCSTAFLLAHMPILAGECCVGGGEAVLEEKKKEEK